MSYRQASLDTINATLLYIHDLGDRWPNLSRDEFHVLYWRLVPPLVRFLDLSPYIWFIDFVFCFVSSRSITCASLASLTSWSALVSLRLSSPTVLLQIPSYRIGCSQSMVPAHGLSYLSYRVLLFPSTSFS